MIHLPVASLKSEFEDETPRSAGLWSPEPPRGRSELASASTALPAAPPSSKRGSDPAFTYPSCRAAARRTRA